MGLGPSNLAILRSDEDIRRLEWADIEEKLSFFRKWDMEDVSMAIRRFKGLERALDKNRPVITGDAAVDHRARRTSWAEYYTVCYWVETERTRKEEDRLRSSWHPTCGAFAMLPDEAALDEFDEYLLGDMVRPALEPYENDEHTDDEPSEEEDDDDEDEDPTDEPGDGEEVAAEPTPSTPQLTDGTDDSTLGAQGEDGPGSQAEGATSDPPPPQDESEEVKEAGEESVEGGAPGTAITDGTVATTGEGENNNGSGSAAAASAKDGDNESSGGGGGDGDGGKELANASSLGSRSGGSELQPAGFDYSQGRYNEHSPQNLQVEKRDRPASFDPSKTSPIFFGFSKVTVEAVYAEAAAKEASREKKEKEVVRRLLQQRREEIEQLREEMGDRRVRRDAKVAKLVNEQTKAAVGRTKELAAAKKIMSSHEFRAFEQTLAADNESVVKAQRAEIAEMEAHHAKLASSEELALAKLVATASAAEKAQSEDRPSGDKLELDGRSSLGRRVKELDEACRALEQAQQRLTMTREEQRKAADEKGNEGGGEEDDDATDAQNERSILIHLEHDVEKGERGVDRALIAVGEAELVLARGVRRRQKERVVLPLYLPLASSLEESDFSAPLLTVVSAMVIACSDSAAEKLRVLATLFDLDNDGWLSQSELTGFLVTLAHVLHAIGYFKTPISEEEAESTVLRCLHDVGVSKQQVPEDGLTLFEAKSWVKGLLGRSPYLAKLFSVDFKFGELSSYARQTISPMTQFEMGLVTLPDLKYRSAKDAVRFRKLLNPDAKLSIHERALGLGADDPLKPDYSRFLPKSKTRTLTNVVPLEHGHLTNLTVHRYGILTRSATKLQNYYRSLQARRKADFQARKRAFLDARNVALDEARKSVEAEYEAKESQEGTAKMKWDSKLRLRQSKLATAGKSMDRAAVLALFLDEAIVAAEDKVKARFLELAVQRGFEEPQSKKDKEAAAAAAAEEAEHPTAVGAASHKVHKKRGVGDQLFGEEQVEILEGELLTPRASEAHATDIVVADPSSNGKGNHPESSRKSSLPSTPGGGDGGGSMVPYGHLPSQPESLTTQRRALMLLGKYPPELYQVGMTDEETQLQIQLSVPDPTHDELATRLQALDPSFTVMKTNDMLKELPSKPLLALYIKTKGFRIDELVQDLTAHFRLVRRTDEIAATLQCVIATDVDSGAMQSGSDQMRQEQESLLQAMAEEEAAVGLKAAAARADRAMRVLGGEDEVTPDQRLDALWQKGEEEFGKKAAVAEELEQSMQRLSKKLRMGRIAMSELNRRRNHLERFVRQRKGFNEPIQVLPDTRRDWMKRYKTALNAPENTPEESRAKYTELSAVGEEFLEAAERGAKTVVDEYFLPHDMKTIPAISARLLDGRCQEAGRGVGGEGIRYKYEAFNMRFKVWRDDHGIFNGSDEFCAKAAGNDLRTCLEYAKCHVSDITFPLEATIDYHGFRVLCVAKLNVEVATYSDSGDLRKVTEDMVLGTANRGENIMAGNRVVNNKLAQAAKRLNLVKHGVRGTKDILNQYLYTSVDMRVFKDSEGKYSAINFWRGLPAEDPASTPHLSLAPRGMSIFWRMLRPEFTKTYCVKRHRIDALLAEIDVVFPRPSTFKPEQLCEEGVLSEPHRQLFSTLSTDHRNEICETRTIRPEDAPVRLPLSPDANCLVEYKCPEWEAHTWAVRDATLQLVNELVPAFAADLASRDLGNSTILTGFGLDLTSDMHRRGINMRHLGLLRSYFWRPVVGTVSLAYNSAELHSAVDLRSQVRRGDYVVLRTDADATLHRQGAPSVHYRVSSDPKATYSAHTLTLLEPLNELSVRGVHLEVGKLENQQNSAELRLLLLAEIVARTLKNVLRFYLRAAATAMKGTSERLHAFIVAEFLNLATGSHENAEDFWSGQLFHAIRSRYGLVAVAEVERTNLRRSLEPAIVYVVNRIVTMLGLRLGRKCIALFNEEPAAFQFTTADLEATGPRRKHNLSVLDFARAQLLSAQASERRARSYESLVLGDGAFLYLKLAERRGSRVAFNKGSGGLPLSGAYGRAVRMEAQGPIANDEMNRAVLFDPKSPLSTPRVDLKYIAELAPMAEDASWCVEAWARALGSNDTERMVVMTGRYALSASRNNVWQLEVFSDAAEVAIHGQPTVIGEWMHLVGSYDGTMARLWCNGELTACEEVRPLVLREIDRKLTEYEATREDLILKEQKARDACKRVSDEQAAAFFKTKEGGEKMRAEAATLVEHAEFKFKMDARAAEKGLKLLKMDEARTMAREEYRAQLYVKNVAAVAETHRKRMEDHVESRRKEGEEAIERATKPMRVGAAVASERSVSGRFLFDGEICHVAVYLGAHSLTADQVRAHYLSGTQQRSLQADRIYALAAVEFEAALEFAPDDILVLEKYAQSLCSALVFDANNADAVRRNKRKVVEAVDTFVAHENADALAEVLRRLPPDYKYGDLACSTYDALLKVNPYYFTLDSHFSIRELAAVPSKFSLTVPGSPHAFMRVAADIFRKVLSEPVLSTVYGEEMLAWAANLKSAEVLCGLIAQAETDSDQRVLDLHVFHPVTNMEDEDLISICDRRRLTLALNLTDCEHLTDSGIVESVRSVTSLQALTLDGCSELSDETLYALKRYTPSLRLLSMQKCKYMTDKALVALFHTCTKIKVLNLNYCAQVSDACLGIVASSCRNLELLHVSLCSGVTDEGLYVFAMNCNSKPLTSMDLSFCRSVGDDAIEVLAKRCSHMQFLNLQGLCRVTDHGIKAVTHNMWELNHLNIEDLFLVTDDVFFFDHERDGRKAADKAMLTSMTTLNVSECTQLTNRALGGIATRCAALRSFHGAGCPEFTEKGLRNFVIEPLGHQTRGEHLRCLNLSFVPNLNPSGLKLLCDAAPELETLNLAGCVLLGDKDMVTISSKCGHVKSLGVSYIKRLTDAALCTFADYLWLEDLDLSGLGHLTDDGIEVLCLEFGGLVKLDLSGCSKLTDDSLDSIARYSEHLRWLKLANCPVFTPAGLASLGSRCPKLRIITEGLVDEVQGKPLDRIVLE